MKLFSFLCAVSAVNAPVQHVSIGNLIETNPSKMCIVQQWDWLDDSFVLSIFFTVYAIFQPWHGSLKCSHLLPTLQLVSVRWHPVVFSFLLHFWPVSDPFLIE